MATRRISDLPAQGTLAGNEYVMIDSENNGTKKYPVSGILPPNDPYSNFDIVIKCSLQDFTSNKNDYELVKYNQEEVLSKIHRGELVIGVLYTSYIYSMWSVDPDSSNMHVSTGVYRQLDSSDPHDDIGVSIAFIDYSIYQSGDSSTIIARTVVTIELQDTSISHVNSNRITFNVKNA